MVVKAQDFYAACASILAHVGDGVVSCLHYKKVCASGYRVELCGLEHVAREHRALALSLDEIGERMPSAVAVFIQMSVVHGADLNVSVIKHYTVGNRINLYTKLRFPSAVCKEECRVDNTALGGVDTKRVIVLHRHFESARKLHQAVEKSRKSADVIDMRMRDKETLGIHNVNAHSVCRVHTALSRIKPIIHSADLKNQRAVMHIFHRLGSRAGAKIINLHFLSLLRI